VDTELSAAAPLPTGHGFHTANLSDDQHPMKRGRWSESRCERIRPPGHDDKRSSVSRIMRLNLPEHVSFAYNML
jgi:hypothetical protein